MSALHHRAQCLLASYSRTGLPPERLAKMVSAEMLLSAQEAVDLGFADGIEGADEGPRVAASVRDVLTCKLVR